MSQTQKQSALSRGASKGQSPASSSGIDILNFFLIWLTLLLALAWPFQLFLFSYIVLGPLHYLTEINWLDKQKYFLRPKDGRVFAWSMVALVLVLSAASRFSETGKWAWSKPLYDAVYGSPGTFAALALQWSWSLTLIAFVTAAAWLFTDRWAVRAPIIVFSVLSSLFFYAMPTAGIIFGLLLPTVFHVFLFTMFFMWHGTLKSRSTCGWWNLVSMVLVVLIIALKPVRPESLYLSDSVAELTLASAFHEVNYVINHWFGLMNDHKADLASPAFFKVQSFLAFAYTYHYLNWFSKTSIIKWHQVEKKKLAFAAVFWVASVALFKVDVRLGFAVAAVLSLLHVVLEFPLNFVSMRSILGTVIPRLKPA
ncbi:MAG: hypothetical protein EPO07_00015 [Verrucomicrobia bacterium]|nr:MAG: hypothetical protein EPO07_00015 [Verrucomicrobiota bacterium]